MGKMKKCKICGADIAKNAKACPQCGAKQKHPIKTILGILAVFLVFIIVIAAISGNGEEPQKVGEESPVIQNEAQNEENSDGQEEGAPEENKPFGVGDKVELNDVYVTLNEVSESEGNDFTSPDEGNIYVIFEFTIENESDKEIAVSSMLSFEAYADDFATQISITALTAADKDQLDGSIASGKKMNGIVAYEVPADWKEMELRFTPDFWDGKEIIFAYTK